MDDYVRRYMKEEISDRNTVNRALLRNTSKLYSFLPVEEGVARADLWPELKDGKLENATNYNFMATLRGTAARSQSPQPLVAALGKRDSAHRRAASSAGKGPTVHGRLLETCQRPKWNRDTKHVDAGEDPLQKCLRESLQAKGYHRDYEAAKREADSLREAEVVRLRRKMKEQEYVTRQLEQQKVLSEQWQYVLVTEKSKRDTLLRGERAIRSKLDSEFRRTFTLVLELTEFNQRKRLFKLAMQQLDELKIIEREEFLEHQMYQKLVKQKELEEIRRQQVIESQRRRADDLMKRFHGLVTQEITDRDKIVRWAVQKLVEYSQLELDCRDSLLRREILDSLVYEEALQRQLITDTHDRHLREIHVSSSAEGDDLKGRAERALSIQREKKRIEELEQVRRRHDQQRVEHTQTESIARSDIASNATKAFSSLATEFLQKVQNIRVSDNESKSRLSIFNDEQTARATISQRGNKLATEALEAAAKRARELEEQRQRSLREDHVEQKRVQVLREKVERQNKPFLGVTLGERTEPPAALLVESLYVDGPSDAAGIKIGDAIVSVGGLAVSSFASMREAIKQHAKMGEQLEVTVMRGTTSVKTSIHVLTADKEFSELKDIFFDTELHGRHGKEESSPLAQTPDKTSKATTPSASPGRPPLLPRDRSTSRK